MSHILMMNNILEEEAGLGSGYCPSLLYPLRFGRTCRTANMRLRAALPRLRDPNRTGWKETANSVAASRFGQQNVSSRGEAITDCGAMRRRRRWCSEEERERKRKRKWLSPWGSSPWQITGLNHHVLLFNPWSCSLTPPHNAKHRQKACCMKVVWKRLMIRPISADPKSSFNSWPRLMSLGCAHSGQWMAKSEGKITLASI